MSFSQWISVFLVYTLVYHMMEPPLKYYEIVSPEEEDDEDGEDEEDEIQELQEDPQLPVQVGDLSTPLLVEAEWPGLEAKETEHCKTPFIARIFRSFNGGGSSSSSRSDQSHIPDLESIKEEEKPSSPKSLRCLAEPKMVRKIRTVAQHTPIHHILQPPLIATVFALVLGMIPKVNTFVFDPDSYFAVITDSLGIIAEAMVPSVMLILGGMLTEGPNESRLGMRTTVGIIVARLLVLPLVGIGIIHLADKLNILISGNGLYRFVLLLQYTTPSAILLGAVASLRGYAVKEASAVLFWQHVFALFSLSAYLILYFKLGF